MDKYALVDVSRRANLNLDRTPRAPYIRHRPTESPDTVATIQIESPYRTRKPGRRPQPKRECCLVEGQTAAYQIRRRQLVGAVRHDD